jgi:hypothetical protein
MEKSEAPAKVRLILPVGDAIVLVQMLGRGGDQDEVNRNVYRISTSGKVVWRIQPAASNSLSQTSLSPMPAG